MTKFTEDARGNVSQFYENGELMAELNYEGEHEGKVDVLTWWCDSSELEEWILTTEYREEVLSAIEIL